MKITIVNLDSDFKHLSLVKTALSKAFSLEVFTRSEHIKISEECFNRKRLKFDAKCILKFLRREGKDSNEKILALFPQDIYVENFNFIYGLAEKKGNVAIVSHFRLNPKFYDQEENLRLFEERVAKECVHEMGHLFWLEHCSNKACAMSFSPNIIFVDKKSVGFCGKCKHKLIDFSMSYL